MCDSCAAVQPFAKADFNFNYKDFGPQAMWRQTMLPHEGYVKIAAQHPPWSQLRGWRLDCVMWDTLRVLFLGIVRDVVASLVKDMYRLGELPTSPSLEISLRMLWEEVPAWCKAGPFCKTLSIDSLGYRTLRTAAVAERHFAPTAFLFLGALGFSFRVFGSGRFSAGAADAE